MRLFIATPVKFNLYQALKNDFSKVVEGKWVEGWNLHITHKFIGKDNPSKFKKPLLIPNEKIKIKGVSTFDDRVLFLKADLKEITSEISKVFNLKSSKFTPHVTLCRIKKIKDKEKFYNLLKKWQNIELEVDYEVYLYKSILTQKGPIYEKIYKY
jgi:2'-5' RNA ligase